MRNIIESGVDHIFDPLVAASLDIYQKRIRKDGGVPDFSEGVRRYYREHGTSRTAHEYLRMCGVVSMKDGVPTRRIADSTPDVLQPAVRSLIYYTTATIGVVEAGIIMVGLGHVRSRLSNTYFIDPMTGWFGAWGAGW